jgi:uncharacterized protein YbjT (DUF2867 family)
LLDAGRPTRVVVRDPARAADLAERGAEIVAADLSDPQALRAAFAGVAGVFAHLPFVPDPAVVSAQAAALAESLESADVPLTVFTLSGPRSSATTGVHSFDTKRAAYDTVTSSRAPLVVFTPLTYLANLSAPFTAPGVVNDGELRYPIPAGQRQPWVSVEDQAALALAALERPDLAGRTFALGRKLTGPELAAGIGEGLGREISYVPLTPQAFAAQVEPMFGPQLAAALIDDYSYLGDGGSDAIDIDPDTDQVSKELGIGYTPVAEWARTQDWAGSAAFAASLTAGR